MKTNTWGANVRENAEKRGRVQTAKTSQKGHLLDGRMANAKSLLALLTMEDICV